MRWQEWGNGDARRRVAVADSRADFVAWITDPGSLQVPLDRCTSVSGSESWTGSRDMDHALEMFQLGWPEVASKVQGMGDKWAGKMADRFDLVSDRRWVEGGGQVSVARYVSGRQDCYRRRRKVEDRTPRRLVRLAAAAVCSASVSTDRMMARGAAVGALIMVLEAAGCSVELWSLPMTGDPRVSEGGWSTGMAAGAAVPIKRADQPLHLPSMVYAMGHPSMARRLAFAALERQSGADRHKLGIPGGYGYPVHPDTTRDVIAHIGGTGATSEADTVIVPMPEHGQHEDWESWLATTLKGLGFQAV